MDTKLVVTGLVALLIGGFGGYVLAGSSVKEPALHDMHSAMQGMTSGLSGKTGDALDKAFLEEMIVHHEGAVEMAEQVLAGTQREELKKMATDIISAQTAEISLMKQWLSEWFAN